MKCSEEGPEGSPGKRGFMHWVHRAVHTDKYTLRAGAGLPSDDVTHYIPGCIAHLWVTTNHPDWKFRGFFARAVNEDGDPVGTWELPTNLATSFWSPPECGPNHIIHRDARLKPFRFQLHFRAPPKGTGRITFHALIKQGDPNTGYFYYPNNETTGRLSLLEARAVAAPVLHEAEARQSCVSFCGSRGQTCDAEAMRSLRSSTSVGLLEMLEPISNASAGVLSTSLCRPPVLQSCSVVAPAVRKASASCFYYSSTCSNAEPPFNETDLMIVPNCTHVEQDKEQAVCEVSTSQPHVGGYCISNPRRLPAGHSGRQRGPPALCV